MSDLEASKNCLKKPTNSDKWRFTIYTVIIFLLVINPYTYIFVNKLLGKIIGKIADPSNGCPTKLGFIVHTIVFTLLLRYIMEFDI
jgi:hypothetical protein